MLLKDMLIKDNKKIKVYAFVGPSGTGKSYRAQMVASEKNINFIIDDGLLIKDNEVIAGESAKKAPTKIETVKHALFYKDEEKEEIIKALKKYKPESIVIPLSFSWSFESITLSCTCSFSLNTWLCFNNASTSVVFPWSTCAIIAMFLIFWLFIFITPLKFIFYFFIFLF